MPRVLIPNPAAADGQPAVIPSIQQFVFTGLNDSPFQVIPHGLGQMPILLSAMLVCTVDDTDNSALTVGQQTQLDTIYQNGSNFPAFSVTCNFTNFYFSNVTAPFTGPGNVGLLWNGTTVLPDLSRYKVIVYYSLTAVKIPPQAPGYQTATDANADSFVAHWLVSVSRDTTNYVIDVSVDSTFGAGNFVAGYQNLNVGTALSVLVTGLTADTGYYYRLRAINANGVSGNSTTVFVQTDVAVGPSDTTATFTITQPLLYIEGNGAQTGGQVLQTRQLTIGTHTVVLTLFNPLTDVLGFALVLGYQNTVEDWNNNGGYSGLGGFVLYFESDLTPNPWQATMLNPTSTEAFPDAMTAAAFIAADGQVPITSLVINNLPG
jgi:hypothetical protein